MTLPANCVVKFTAEWCKPCQNIRQLCIDECATHNVRMVEVDVDADADAVRVHRVKSLPTFICLRNGVEHERVVGANVEQIKKMIAANPGSNQIWELPVNTAATVHVHDV